MGSDSKTLELQIRIAAEDAARTVSSLKGEIQSLTSEAKKFSGTEGAALEKTFKDAGAAAKDTSASIGDIKKAIGNLTEVVAAAKALSFIKDLGAFALKTADNFQTARNQFGILLGDMQAGAGLFNEIKAFNDVTPFNLDTLTQATNVLIAAKVPLQDLQKQLTKFGDLSQGNSQKLTSYVNAFSQAAAKGKADMQVLNTYLHQGVPILDALARNFSVTTSEIVKMASEGEIGFADFSKALDDLTAAGGRYFGGMELSSKSLAAMQEGLNEAVNTLSASFGEMLLPAATAVVGALTDMANAINESPILKGLFAGALTAIAGYLSVMAIKASIAFAQQMALNFAIGALNPAVMAATVAAAALAAGYVAVSANTQKAIRDQENFALALNKAVRAVDEWKTAMRTMSQQERVSSMADAAMAVTQYSAAIERAYYEIGRYQTDAARFGTTYDREIQKERDRISSLEKLLQEAKKNLENARTAAGDLKKEELPVPAVSIADDSAAKAAENWRKQWEEQYARFKAEISGNPFAMMELELELKLTEARSYGANREILNQIEEYFGDQRSKKIKEIYDEEERIATSLSNTRIDDIEYQKRKELENIDLLEQKRILSAAYTEEEIAKIRERFARKREDIELKFEIEIDKAKLDEAREAVKNWQEELSDSLLTGIMKLKIFSDEASVIISDLTAQLIELSASAALSGFEEFGRALGEGENAAESMSRALAEMAEQILRQLPMMFLQAGLQLIASGQWALGLGFIAAAGSSAIISGYVDGASKHAQGGVFDEYGQAARFASGGAFTNQIVSSPTFFAHGGGFGLMGEAGPEAIMPLTRMPDGNLGVQTAGGGANVIVNIINNSNAEVRQEESTDGEGNKQIDVMIGQFVNNHITSGKADRAMSRFGVRPVGV